RVSRPNPRSGQREGSHPEETATVVQLLRTHTSLFSPPQHLMNERDGDRSFADSGCDALDVAAAHVADREDAGTARFEEIRRPRQRPRGCRQLFRRQVWTGLDEPARVEG